MNRIYFCLLIPLTFLVKTSFAQDSNTTAHSTPQILSASGFERNGTESFRFSVGNFNTIIRLSAESRIFNKGTPRDTLAVSPTLNDSIPKNFTESGSGTEQYQTDNAAGISVFPNPFSDTVTLTIEDFKSVNGEGYRINLLDFTGNVVHSAAILNPQEEIIIRNVPKGIYLLSLYKNGRKINTIKLLKTNP